MLYSQPSLEERENQRAAGGDSANEFYRSFNVPIPIDRVSSFFKLNEGIRPQYSMELRPRRFNEEQCFQREEIRNSLDKLKETKQT